MKFANLKTRIPDGHYKANISWRCLPDALRRYKEEAMCPLDIEPDFQRGHVWTEEQQVAYVEFKLSGGAGSNIIQLNCPGWMSSFDGPFVLVDGLQRITAVARFLNNEIKAFWTLYSEFEDSLGSIDPDFIFCVNNLKTRAEVLTWYIEMNTGGTPHTREEIARVCEMLHEERKLEEGGR